MADETIAEEQKCKSSSPARTVGKRLGRISPPALAPPLTARADAARGLSLKPTSRTAPGVPSMSWIATVGQRKREWNERVPHGAKRRRSADVNLNKTYIPSPGVPSSTFVGRPFRRAASPGKKKGSAFCQRTPRIRENHEAL